MVPSLKEAAENRVGGKQSSFLPTFVFRTSHTTVHAGPRQFPTLPYAHSDAPAKPFIHGALGTFTR